MVPPGYSLAFLALSVVHTGVSATSQLDCVPEDVAQSEVGADCLAVSMLQAPGNLQIHLQSTIAEKNTTKLVLLAEGVKDVAKGAKSATSALPPSPVLLAEGAKGVEPCPGANTAAMVAFVVVVGVALLTFTISGLQPRSYGNAERACVVQMLILFVTNLTFTVIVPTSYLVSRVAGHGATYSGVLIGIYQAGCCLGSFMMWCALQKSPNVWKSAKPLLVTASTFNVIGGVMYCAISVVAESSANEESLGKIVAPMPWLTVPLLISRLVDGFGTGITVQLGQVLIVHLIPSEQRPRWMANLQFASMLGIGFGPLLGSMIGCLNICRVPTQHLTAVGIGYVGFALSAFTLAVTRFPSDLGELQDFQPPEEVQTARPGQEDAPSAAAHLCLQAKLEDWDRHGRVMVVVGALLMALIRGFVVSGVEASASLLLEVKYHWETNTIGLAVGMCFLFCVPVKLLYNSYEKQLSILNWIRILGSGSVVGGLLLYSWSEAAAMAYVLLLGDALLFPTLFLSDGLSAGLMMMSQHLLPKGSLFDVNTVVFFRSIALSTGRSLGPPLARMVVDSHGQNGYANQQMMAAVAFLIVFEFFVARHAKLDPPKQ